MFRAARIENRAGVNLGTDLKGNTSWEVCLDNARDHVYRGALCGHNQVNANGTCKLGKASDRHFNLFAGSHNQIGKLVNHQNNVGQIAVPLLWVEFAGRELYIVFLKIPHHGRLQQFVTLVHLNAQGVQGVNYLVGVGNNGLIVPRQLGQEVPFNGVVKGQFYLFGVHQHKLYLCRMLLVQNRCDNRIEPHRLTLPRSASHEQVGHFGQVNNKNFV